MDLITIKFSSRWLDADYIISLSHLQLAFVIGWRSTIHPVTVECDKPIT